MLESLPIALVVGCALGFLAGLGVGGGSLLVLWLTLILGMAHSEARIINLLFFLPAAVVACFFRRKQGKLDFKKALPAMLTGVISAACFAWIGQRMDMTLLKKLFGGLLLFTGLRELFYRPRKAR